MLMVQGDGAPDMTRSIFNFDTPQGEFNCKIETGTFVVAVFPVMIVSIYDNETYFGLNGAGC